jgi:chemotaxis protein methyltransferase CheR
MSRWPGAFSKPAETEGVMTAFSPPALTEQDFELVRNLAYRTFGLDLRRGKEELISARLGTLMRTGGFRSFADFYRHLQHDKTGESLTCLIDALATNHTSFLREPDHFEFLRREVLPGLAGREHVDVWSAACSTGEEIWTLACILNEALPVRTIRLFGTDISTRALKFAERAVYPAERCANLTPAWLSKYFSRDRAADAYTVCPRLRAQAQFSRRNLLDNISWPRPFPVVFCRNVMIYFDRQTQEQVVSRLASALEPGGYLFVGHAESLLRITHSLEYVRPAVYRKRRSREGQWTKS